MDWISFSASAAAALVDSCLSGRNVAQRVARHNAHFTASHDRWFSAIYRDKYYYMGDHELMTLAFRLDLGSYYLGVVARPFQSGNSALGDARLAPRGGRFAGVLMALYKPPPGRDRAIANGPRNLGDAGTPGRYFGFYQLRAERAPHAESDRAAASCG